MEFTSAFYLRAKEDAMFGYPDDPSSLLSSAFISSLVFPWGCICCPSSAPLVANFTPLYFLVIVLFAHVLYILARWKLFAFPNLYLFGNRIRISPNVVSSGYIACVADSPIERSPKEICLPLAFSLIQCARVLVFLVAFYFPLYRGISCWWVHECSPCAFPVVIKGIVKLISFLGSPHTSH